MRLKNLPTLRKNPGFFGALGVCAVEAAGPGATGDAGGCGIATVCGADWLLL